MEGFQITHRFLTSAESDIALLAREVVKKVALPSEGITDIICGGLDLATQRAELLGRRFVIGYDLPYCLSIFHWWPFAPVPHVNNGRILLQHRWALFTGACDDTQVTRRLIRAVSPELLTFSLEGLFDVLATQPISDFINFQDPNR